MTFIQVYSLTFLCQVPWLTHEGRIYFDRDTVFSLSRLTALSDWADALSRTSSSSDDANGVAESNILAVEEMVEEKGLQLGRDFVRRGNDRTAYIGLHALLSVFSQVRMLI